MSTIMQINGERFLTRFQQTRVLGVAVVVAAVVGCAGGEPGSVPSGETKSAAPTAVVVDGSSTVFRISKAAQLGFAKEKPDLRVLVANHGTGGGFSRYLEG